MSHINLTVRKISNDFYIAKTRKGFLIHCCFYTWMQFNIEFINSICNWSQTL